MNEKEKLIPQRRFKEFKNTGTWEQRKLIDVAEMFDNLRIPVTASDRVEGNTAYYGANGIQDYVDGFTHDGEFVLIAEDGANDLINYPVNYVKGKIWVNNHAHVVSGKKSELDNLFLTARIKSMNISHWLVGGGRAKLNGDVLKKIPLTLPIYEEQKKIGAFFKQLDDAIALHQRKLDKTKSLKSAYLLEMFPAEGERKPKRRFAGFTDDWEQRKLMETNTSFTDGNYGESYPSGNDMSDSRNGVPFLRGSNLKNGKLDNSGANYITLEKHKELTSGHLVYDDIVIAVRGSLGALGYVDIDNVDWNINSQLAIIRTDKSELNGAFVIQFLSSNKGQKELLSRQTGTALKQLPIKQLQDVPVPKPELAEQNKISEFFRQLDDTIALHQHHLDNHKELKKALLQKMFPRNGEKLPEVRFGGFTEVWEKRKLNKVMSDFIVPMRDKPKEFSGEIPWTRIEDIEGKYLNDSLSGQYVSQAIIEKMNLKVIPKDSLIVSVSATFGVVAIVTQDLITNQTFIGLVPEANFDLDFLYTLFQTPTVRTKMKFESAGSTIFYITRQTFENMQFLLPSYEEQQSIGSFFKNIDDTITLLQQKLNDYQRLKKVMLQQMFV